MNKPIFVFIIFEFFVANILNLTYKSYRKIEQICLKFAKICGLEKVLNPTSRPLIIRLTEDSKFKWTKSFPTNPQFSFVCLQFYKLLAVIIQGFLIMDWPIRSQCTLSLPPEDIRKPYGFQGAEKVCIGNEWVTFKWKEQFFLKLFSIMKSFVFHMFKVFNHHWFSCGPFSRIQSLQSMWKNISKEITSNSKTDAAKL